MFVINQMLNKIKPIQNMIEELTLFWVGVRVCQAFWWPFQALLFYYVRFTS